MPIELLLKFNFEASHSLVGYEVIHPHLWRLELGIFGQPLDGRVVDLVILREKIQTLIKRIHLTVLNENPFVSASVRQFPTCETLSQYFCEELQGLLVCEFLPYNPSVSLSWVMVAICSMDGVEMGAARLEPGK